MTEPGHAINGTEYGQYAVVVTNWSDEVLRWEGQADNVSDALSRALDHREDEVRDGDWWRAAGKDGGPV